MSDSVLGMRIVSTEQGYAKIILRRGTKYRVNLIRSWKCMVSYDMGIGAKKAGVIVNICARGS